MPTVFYPCVLAKIPKTRPLWLFLPSLSREFPRRHPSSPFGGFGHGGAVA